ncbi:MAG: hypothetical protein ACKVJG_07880 [Candidatus Latescibacterota bacterium]|jgi:hypothetical protein
MDAGAVPRANIAACGGSEVLARLLWHRGARVVADIVKRLGHSRYLGTPPDAMLYNPEEAGKKKAEVRDPDVSVELSAIDEKLLRGLYRITVVDVDAPEPVFVCPDVHLVNVAANDLARRHSRLLIEDERGDQLPANWWHMAPLLVPKGVGDATFYLRVDDRFGRLEVRAELIAFDVREKGIGDLPTKDALPFVVEDWRREETPLPRVQSLKNIQIWAEGSAAENGVATRRRDELVAGQPLALWTRAPSPDVLRAVLQYVQPDHLWFCAPPLLSLEKGDFLRALGSLTKAVVARRSGTIRRVELAARLAQTEGVVLAGLDILQAMGLLRYRSVEERVLLEQGDGQRRGNTKGQLLEDMLREVAAYRRYIEDAAIGDLFE